MTGTAYVSPLAAKKFPARSPNVAAGVKCALYDLSGSISTWASGDTITFGSLPKGAIVTGVKLQSSAAIDTNGSPTLHVEVGYAGSATAFMAATAFGASSDELASGNCLVGPLAADEPLLLTVSTAAATPAAGAVALVVDYSVEPAAASNP